MKKACNFTKFLAIFLLSTLVLFPHGLASAQVDTVVSVSGPEEVNPGEQFTIDIIVAPEASIAGAQFNLAFDSSLVTVDSVAEGNLLSQGGATTYFSSGTVDNSAGTISGVAGAITTPGQTVSAPGTFAVITLTASMSGGTSSITLSNVIVGDINGQSVQVNVVSDQVTINGNDTPPPNGGGGSNSGGGSGGGGGSSGGVTTVYDTVTSSGRFLSDVTAKSEDRNVILYIPKDTIGLNRNGYPLITITIKEKKPTPTPPEYAEIIGLAYEITPSGSTMSPPASLTIKYNDSKLPQGVAEKNLVIASYDTQSKEWQNLECTVDIANNAVMTHLDTFSVFAILAYTRPASFEVTDFSVSPEEASVGKEMSISLLITNTGDLTESHVVSLKLGNTLIQTKEVTLAGGDSELVTFSTTPDTAGIHQLIVGDSLATFTIEVHKAAATFTASTLAITPDEFYLGDSVSIGVLVTNTGSLPGTYDVVLKIDGEMIETKEVILDGGDSETVSFSFIPESTGQFAVNVNGLVGLYEVEEPPPAPVVEEVVSPEPEINSFSVTPIYDAETGKLVSATIKYQINDAGLLTPESELTLKVLYEGEFLEEIPLLPLGQMQPGGNTGSLGYIPTLGWRAGLYTFQAELYEGESLIDSPEQSQFTVTPESITTVVSWRTLGVIIGGMVILIMIVLAIVLYRRRDMFTGYIDDYTR